MGYGGGHFYQCASAPGAKVGQYVAMRIRMARRRGGAAVNTLVYVMRSISSQVSVLYRDMELSFILKSAIFPNEILKLKVHI